MAEETDDLNNLQWRRLPHLRMGPAAEMIAGQARYGESGLLAFDTNTSKHFVRLRYADGLLDPFAGDFDRDGVGNFDEVTGAQTDPFGYPDDDDTDTDVDGLPDAWESYRAGNLDQNAASTLTPTSTTTYAALYAAQRADTDADGLPDDWERFRCGGSLAENAATTHDGKTNLARYREDRVKLTVHRYGAQEFSYREDLGYNAFDPSPTDALRVYLRGSSGGSMIVQYSNNTYTAISSVRVWPSNRNYGLAEGEDDETTHYANYAGTLLNGAYDYTFSATPDTGAYVARDLLRSLDAVPLIRAASGGATHRLPARLAITSLPLTSVEPSTYPVILRDFPYAKKAFPEFGGDWRVGYGSIEPILEGGPLLGFPKLKREFLENIQDTGQRFASWYSHRDAFAFNLPVVNDGYGIGVRRIEDFFPHQNDVGTPIAERSNPHGFTVELHLWLDYDLATTQINLSTDDDCWVFIDGRLAIDLGGRVPLRTVSALLADLKAEVKSRDGEETVFLESTTGSCQVDIFYAERETSQSSFAFQSNSPLHPVYVYQVVADADLLTGMTYTLTQAPTGMTIDAKTGRILWDYLSVNRDADSGNNLASGAYPVTVSVTDARGLSATQSFTVTLSLPTP